MNLEAAVIISIGNQITFSQLNESTGLTKYSFRTSFSHPEKKSVPENIVKIRRKVKERWNRRTLHRRRMKKKIQRVSISYIIVIIENIYHFISLYIQTLGVSIPISVPSRCLRGLWRN